MDVKLPPEIWSKVGLTLFEDRVNDQVNDSFHREIVKLSKVSTFLWNALLPLRYRFATLSCGPSKKHLQQLSLFAQNSIAIHVRYLTIKLDMEFQFKEGTCVPSPQFEQLIIAINNMHALEKIIFVGYSFMNECMKERFWNLFYHRNKSLSSLEFSGGYDVNKTVPTVVANGRLPISGLRHISWWNPNLSGTLWNVVQSSYASLRVIRAPLEVLKSGNENCPFWNLRFPSLQEIGCTRWEPDLFEPLGVVTEFLKEHATNTRFNIVYQKRFSVIVAFALENGNLVLQSASAHVEFLKILGQKYLDRIVGSSMRSLVLAVELDSWGVNNSLENFHEFVDVMTKSRNRVPAWSAIECLSLHCTWDDMEENELLSHANFVTLLDEVRQLCSPTLKALSIREGVGAIRVKDVVRSFRVYTNLEVIDISMGVLVQGTTMEEYALQLNACCCPKLRRVIFRPIDQGYRVSNRKPFILILGTDREGRPKICDRVRSDSSLNIQHIVDSEL